MGTDLSIIVYDSSQESEGEAAKKANLVFPAKAHISSLKLKEIACDADGMTSRDTWIFSAFVMVDKHRLASTADRARCISAALDFVNGVPFAGGFDYLKMPSDEARLNIMRSIVACSKLGLGEAGKERTRDGLTPKPTISCLLDNL